MKKRQYEEMANCMEDLEEEGWGENKGSYSDLSQSKGSWVLFWKAFDMLGLKVRMCKDTSCRKSCDTLTRIDLDIQSERSKNILSLLYCPPPAQTVSSLVKGTMPCQARIKPISFFYIILQTTDYLQSTMGELRRG